MGKKCGQQSINFSQPPVITSGANIVGPEEGEGPLASGFDWILDDPLFGEKSWEMAECKMLEESAKLALQKIALQTQDVDFFLAGDLLNQIISSNYAARGLEIPFFGRQASLKVVSIPLSKMALLVSGDRTTSKPILLKNARQSG